jgi:TonB family protein
MEELPTPRSLNGEVSEGVSEAVMRALALRTEDRYATVEALRKGLAVAPELKAPSEPSPPPPPVSEDEPELADEELTTVQWPKPPFWAYLALLVVVLLRCAGLDLFNRAQPESPPPSVATEDSSAYPATDTLTSTIPLEPEVGSESKGNAEKSEESKDNSTPGVGMREVESEEEGDAYMVVEQMPALGSCRSLREEERNQCTQMEMIQFISQNTRYPTSAREEGVEGTVYVYFEVGKDGSVRNSRVIRAVDSRLDAEALRVVSSLPSLEPGIQGGRAVNVQYTLPVRFVLR